MSRRCFSDHMGAWAIAPEWLRQAVAAIQSGAWAAELPADVRPVLGHELEGTEARGFAVIPQSRRAWHPASVWPNGDRPEASGRGVEDRGFQLAGNRGDVAIVSIAGPMMKHRSKFGGTSTIETRRALREATASRDVRAILLHVDSPGGHVAGTLELAEDVAAARRRKPVHAFVEDLGASAAYWAASQAARITVNPTGQVGSIGTVAVLFDESERFEAAGVKTHVVSTGAIKGAGAPGAPITAEQLEHVRELVEDLNGHFLAAVGKGRKLGAKKLRAVSDGRTFIGRKALEAGLVDAVGSVDDAIRELEAAADARGGSGRRTTALAGALPAFDPIDEEHDPEAAAELQEVLEAQAAQEAQEEAEAAERLEHRRKAAKLRRRRLELED